jgi:4-amino-4-deoxy-L-arabinose transferase-like glycosyltransferase
MSQVNVQTDKISGQHLQNKQKGGTQAWGSRFFAWRFSHWILGLIVFIVALGFDLYRLGTPSIWFDEAFSVELARQPLPHLWSLIFGPEPNMELYYLFLHFWLKATGLFGLNPTEVVVRFPSAIFAALSSVVVFAIGRRFLGNMGGIVSACFYLLNDLQLIYAQQTRSYSLQLLLTCLAWYMLLRALNEQESVRRWWIGYVIANVLAIYAHLFSVLIFGAQIVFVGGLLIFPTAWRKPTRQQLLPFGVSLCVTGVLIIPMMLVSLQGAKTGWLPSPHLADVVYFLMVLSGYSKPYLGLVAGSVLLGLALAGLGYFFRKRDFGHGGIQEGWTQTLNAARDVAPLAWALLCWFLVPFVVSYIISQGSTRLFSSRYLVAIVPPIMLLAGLGITVLRWRVLRVILALIMLGIALKAVPFYYETAQVEDWNTATHWLEQRYQSNDGLVCYDNTLNGSVKQGCQISVEYYLQAYPSGAHFTADSPGAFSWQTYSAPDPEAAIRLSDLAQFGSKHGRIFLIIGRVRDQAADRRVQAALQWLSGHYHLEGQITTKTVKVYLFNTHI